MIFSYDYFSLVKRAGQKNLAILFQPFQNKFIAAHALFEPFMNSGDSGGTHSGFLRDFGVAHSPCQHSRNFPPLTKLHDLLFGKQISEKSTCLVQIFQLENCLKKSVCILVYPLIVVLVLDFFHTLYYAKV